MRVNVRLGQSKAGHRLRYAIAGLAALALVGLGSTVRAQNTLEVTFGYLERIALPPDAVAEIALIDMSGKEGVPPTLSLQRFAVSGVPMTVLLHYDAQLIREEGSYGLTASLSSDGKVIFALPAPHPVLAKAGTNAVTFTLKRVSGETPTSEPMNADIAGIWTITELDAQGVEAESPPTLAFDDPNRFGLYSGCNTYAGQVITDQSEGDENATASGSLNFPRNFAGTLMACPGPREELQREVLDVISRIAGYQREDDLLELTDAEGAVIMRLQNQP